MSVGAIGGAGAAQALGGATLERAQRLVAEAPRQAEAFQQALQAAGGADSTIAGAATPAGGVTGGGVTGGVGGAERPGHVLGKGPAEAPGTAERLLNQVETGQQRLNEILGQLDSGRAFSAHEMLGLQAEMHQLMRQLETTTKMMGEVVSGAKTLMQQQV